MIIADVVVTKGELESGEIYIDVRLDSLVDRIDHIENIHDVYVLVKDYDGSETMFHQI